MTIDFSCEKCEASFEIDAAEIIDGSERLKCPNCDTKAPQALVDDFSNSLGDLCKAIAALRKKFGVSLALETDDLPAPFDADGEAEEEDEEGAASDDDLLEAPVEEEEDE
jgi:DNA-directed RNA polymerase subunit RPC12/RpoP